MVTARPTQPSPLLCRPDDACPTSSAPATVRLAAKSVWAAPASTRAVRCVAGLVWITQEGDSRDHVLSGGQSFTTTRGGRIVVQAMDDSTIRA